MTLQSQLNPEFKDLDNARILSMWEKNRQERKELIKALDNADFASNEARKIEKDLDLNDLASWIIEEELCARNLDY